MFNVVENLYTPNLQEDYQRGLEYAALRQEREAQNALRAAMSQYGAGAMRGDANALSALAALDPEYAQGLMSGHQQMDLRSREDDRQAAQAGRQAEAHGLGMEYDRERLSLLRAEGQREAQKYAASLKDEERLQEQAELDRASSMVSRAWEAGPDEFNRAMAGPLKDILPPEFKGMTYENAPYITEYLAGASEGFKAPKPVEPTAEMRNLEFRAREAGLQPGTPEWQQFMAQGGAPRGTTLSVGPDGAVQFRDGPLGVDTKAQRQADMATTTSDVVTGAAGRAADLSDSFATTGLLGSIAARIPNSRAAELRNEVEALRANASIANIAAMRAASPTGAGMGNPTDSEHRMLQAALGAINPDAKPEVFQRQLADYERALLRTVHGVEAGDRIWREQGLGSRGNESPPTEDMPQSARDAGIDPDLWQYLSPEDQALWK